MGNYMSNQLSYRHTQRVVVRTAMEAGGCGAEFRLALRDCAGGKKKTTAEVLECMEWTACLRRCMERNECHFKSYIKMMDNGLDQDEGKEKRSLRSESEEDRWRWRWWTGMIRFPQQPASKNKFNF
jgi:hypothetical protein